MVDTVVDFVVVVVLTVWLFLVFVGGVDSVLLSLSLFCLSLFWFNFRFASSPDLSFALSLASYGSGQSVPVLFFTGLRAFLLRCLFPLCSRRVASHLLVLVPCINRVLISSRDLFLK